MTTTNYERNLGPQVRDPAELSPNQKAPDHVSFVNS